MKMGMRPAVMAVMAVMAAVTTMTGMASLGRVWTGCRVGCRVGLTGAQGRGWRCYSARPDSAGRWSTQLAGELATAIETTGPISVAAYMRQCLTSPDRGYYTASRPVANVGEAEETVDHFGHDGDFITSPEISQVFGELVGVWLVAEWIGQRRLTGSPLSSIRLIELGPGRGTLMDDVVRTICRFGEFADAVKSVDLVEASDSLREKQRQRLCRTTDDVGSSNTAELARLKGVSVRWHDQLSDVPVHDGSVPFIIAHEFFDALPIHVFESMGGQDGRAQEWVELMVSSIKQQSRESKMLVGRQDQMADKPEFRLVRSTGPTNQARILTGRSARYRSASRIKGSVIEICPDGLSICEQIANRIGDGPSGDGKAAGAALVIDYGTSQTIPTNSLRGIRAHRRVSPFSSSGMVDLSADVDFVGLAESAISASTQVEVHGPVQQSAWLTMMGGHERVKSLIGKTSQDNVADRITRSWNRLIDVGPNGMGKTYHALAIVPDRAGKPPVGFGGDI